MEELFFSREGITKFREQIDKIRGGSDIKYEGTMDDKDIRKEICDVMEGNLIMAVMNEKRIYDRDGRLGFCHPFKLLKVDYYLWEY